MCDDSVTQYALFSLDYALKHFADEQDRARKRLKLGQWRAALFRKNHGYKPVPGDKALIRELGTEDKMFDVRK